MSVRVIHEDTAELKKWGIGLEHIIERCVFCGTPTRYWHRRSNNPVCPGCAKTATVAELLKINDPRRRPTPERGA